jgi:pilus assembly protein TadC
VRAAELPVVTDLLAACLSSGANGTEVLRVVTETAAVATRDDLRRVTVALQMGASPDEAWEVVQATDLRPLATVMRRSALTGAPVSYLLGTLSNDLRADARTAALSDARKLGVRSAGPLGLCFLPAFILIGVVPLVISLVAAWA